MPSRERKRATLLRRIGMATTLLVTSSLLFGTVPVLAATGPGAANSGSIVTAAAKTLSPAPTPKITGTLKVGATLTAVPGTWGPTPVALTYAWIVGGVAKATTVTYKMVAADVGKTIVVKVTGKKTGYTTLTKSSAATSVVVGTLTAAPTPTISGTVKVGSTLTAASGTWGPAPVALSFAWSVGGVAKATTATYKIVAADAGKIILVKVTGKKTGYTTVTKTSAATVAVPAVIGTLAPAPTPTITGTVKVGSTLTATPGTWGPSPVALTYAWSVGGVVKATTATYKIAAADAGKTVVVKVTGTKTGYTTLTKTSAATVPVPATVGTLSPAPTPTITGTVKVGSTLTAVPGTWGPAHPRVRMDRRRRSQGHHRHLQNRRGGCRQDHHREGHRHKVGLHHPRQKQCGYRGGASRHRHPHTRAHSHDHGNAGDRLHAHRNTRHLGPGPGQPRVLLDRWRSRQGDHRHLQDRHRRHRQDHRRDGDRHQGRLRHPRQNPRRHRGGARGRRPRAHHIRHHNGHDVGTRQRP
jgi:hypothetical protein